MKKIILSFFISVLFFVPYLAFAGTSYYCDCSVSGGTSGDGSWGNPFESIADINDASFSTGDDLYFKVGETCTATEKLSANWNGTSGDHVVIGAYYGEGQFGLNGGARPILDGQLSVPGNSSYQGLIHDGGGAEYIDVKDLNTYRSGYYAVYIEGSNITYDNIFAQDSYNGGLFINLGAGGSGATVTDCILTGIGQVNNPSKVNNFAGLAVIGRGNSGSGDEATNITVARNKLYNNFCSEVLSIWGKTTGAVAENNVLYDNKHANVSLYSNASRDMIIRYNLIYTSSDVSTWGREDGIGIDGEDYLSYCWTGGNEVYGNLIANMDLGIEVGCSKTDCEQDDTLIYNNTFVDNTTNIKIWSSAEGGSGNQIKNNISWTQSRGDHVNNCSPGGWTFGYNLWDDDPGTGNCDAGSDPANANPLLSKSSDWTSLTAGSVDGTEFSIASPDSPALDSGLVIAGHNDRISASDFTASPPTVTTTDDGTNPEIGAWYYDSATSRRLFIID